MSRVPSLTQILEQVAGHPPEVTPEYPADPRAQAAVAIVLHEPDGPGSAEMLFIERATRDGDPWSGQMAFPGGRREAADPDSAVTAARETLEEVGIALPEPVGRLDDFSNARQAARLDRVELVYVAPYVYAIDARPDVRLNYEVASTVWIPIDWMLHPDSVSTYELDHDVYRGVFPAFTFDRYQVWGMTYRILESLFETLDLELPARRLNPGLFDDEPEGAHAT